MKQDPIDEIVTPIDTVEQRAFHILRGYEIVFNKEKSEGVPDHVVVALAGIGLVVDHVIKEKMELESKAQTCAYDNALMDTMDALIKRCNDTGSHIRKYHWLELNSMDASVKSTRGKK